MRLWSSGLFGGVLERGEVPAAVGDEAWLHAMLQVEAALAEVQAFSGLIDPAAADAIGQVAKQELFDVNLLGGRAVQTGDPVAPLVESLRAALPEAYAGAVHHAASSQDVLDTAGMLIASRALRPLLNDLATTAELVARLARQHRDTRMTGRSMLQRSLPTTFGLKAAGWLTALDAARWRLEQVRRDRLAVQFGGPAGTLAQLGETGPEMVEGLATVLGLTEPIVPWHTDRTRIAELAGALGGAAGVVAKIARDLILLAQPEVGEISSPQPSAAVCAAGCAAGAPGLVANLLAAMAHEHERAAGAWQAEWRPMRELLTATGSAAAWLRSALELVWVNADVMAANLGDQAADRDAAGLLVDRALEHHDKGPARAG